MTGWELRTSSIFHPSFSQFLCNTIQLVFIISLSCFNRRHCNETNHYTYKKLVSCSTGIWELLARTNMRGVRGACQHSALSLKGWALTLLCMLLPVPLQRWKAAFILAGFKDNSISIQLIRAAEKKEKLSRMCCYTISSSFSFGNFVNDH